MGLCSEGEGNGSGFVRFFYSLGFMVLSDNLSKNTGVR